MESAQADWLTGMAIKITLWRRLYNEDRPHSSLGYLQPTVFRQSGKKCRQPKRHLSYHEVDPKWDQVKWSEVTV